LLQFFQNNPIFAEEFYRQSPMRQQLSNNIAMRHNNDHDEKYNAYSVNNNVVHCDNDSKRSQYANNDKSFSANNYRSRDNQSDRHKYGSRKRTSSNLSAFVCNISFQLNEAEIREVFDNVAEVTNFNLVDRLDDDNQIVKRFAFVTVDKQSDLDAIIDQNGYMLHNRPLVIRVADANITNNNKKRVRSTSNMQSLTKIDGIVYCNDNESDNDVDIFM
jgi:RNA recognition motif-containing protein